VIRRPVSVGIIKIGHGKGSFYLFICLSHWLRCVLAVAYIERNGVENNHSLFAEGDGAQWCRRGGFLSKVEIGREDRARGVAGWDIEREGAGGGRGCT
jgi:hypothetical protein